MTSIGIDFGTTYTKVGVWQNGEFKCIPNENGNINTPSCVAFSGSQILVGEPAKMQEFKNPANTIVDLKSIIGRRVTETIFPEIMKDHRFTVDALKDDRPFFKVTFNGETKTFSPEEITSMILLKMKENAESFLGKPVNSAVISVPAFFNSSQRQAMIDAGTIAGFDSLNLINEPTAAAINIGKVVPSDKERTVLIYDFGGGKLEASMVNIVNDMYQIYATAANPTLGGEDFDIMPAVFLSKQYKQDYSEGVFEPFVRCRIAFEQAKCVLSRENEAPVQIKSSTGNFCVNTSINVAKFEELNLQLIVDSLKPFHHVIYGRDKKEITQVTLIGGSSNIPKVQHCLEEAFQLKPVIHHDPFQAVCYGASIRAAILKKECEDINIKDIISRNIGLFGSDICMDFILEKKSPFPQNSSQKVTKTIYTYDKLIQVFEGDREPSKKNTPTDRFQLSCPNNIEQIEIIFEIDSNGVITLKPKDEGGKITITKVRDLTDEDIRRMAKEIKQLKLYGKV